jgi:hypothetical protein
MRKHLIAFVLAFLGFAGFAAFAVWAFLESSHLQGGWESLEPIWPYVAGGLVGVGLLTGVLMWLAFYSANHGYDDNSGR